MKPFAMSRRPLLAGVAAVAGVCAALVAVVLDGTPADRAAQSELFPQGTRPATSRDVTDRSSSLPSAGAVGDGRSRRRRPRSGYRGTQAVRDSDDHAPEPAADTRSWIERTGYYPRAEELDSVARELTSAATYPQLLRVLHRLGGRAESIACTNSERRSDGRHETTRFQREPERMATMLDGALAATTDGIRRQSLLFQLAIALPAELARPRLRVLWTAGGEDAEDALLALAFSGDTEAVAAFDVLSWTPSRASVHRLVDDEYALARIEAEGLRDVLRSYRAIEVLDGAPYFHIHGLWYHEANSPFPWRTPTAAAPDPALAARLLEGWLRRYPGHPGSDDMAYRLGMHHARLEHWTEAARWASRAATFPDQDMRRPATTLLKTVVELAPRGDDVLTAAIDPDEPWRNRTLLRYLMLRRRAADAGFDAALRDLERLAEREPAATLSIAYRERWTAPVPRGLDSGVAPLARDDRLRYADETTPQAEPDPRYDWSLPAAVRNRLRLHPPLEAAPLPRHKLRRQFRAWSTLAELSRRAERAGSVARTDLAYMRAAVFYHERYVLFPVYGNHDQSRNGLPQAGLLLGRWSAEADARDLEWLRTCLSHERAIALFELITRNETSHPVADRAAFSTGMAHIKSAGTRALRNFWDAGHWTEVERHIVAGVEAFERAAQLHPYSPLADDARAAAGYWRRERPSLWER